MSTYKFFQCIGAAEIPLYTSNHYHKARQYIRKNKYAYAYPVKPNDSNALTGSSFIVILLFCVTVKLFHFENGMLFTCF